MRITHYCLTFLALAIAYSLSAQASLWTKLDEKTLSNRSSERWIVPERYEAFALDVANLNQSIYNIPVRDESGQSGSVLEIPMPDGGTELFEVWDAPLMQSELAARYRNIKTFSGQGITNPAAAIYMDWTPQGFHAMIMAPGKVSFIDPYFSDDNSLYVVYDRADYHDDAHHAFSCGAENETIYSPSIDMEAAQAANRAVTNKRTYRLAVAASGEYTSYHGGTKALALAAINTTINRVRGIYETEMGVSFTLVATMDSIIFTNSATDPYSLPPTLPENQTTIDSKIGSANYDIGHVFGAGGGGGIATVSSVCNNASKARGMTASTNPKTDAFDVDYVAHELGHQFGAHHTFNGGVVGSCTVSNYYAATAFEPGSGSTIMAYTGLCGAQNLQRRTDAYFHAMSISEIRTYTTSGTGGTCGTSVATSNNSPTANADPNGMDGKYIPISTPFELTGAGTDPDGNPITYVWEQVDLGAQGAPSSASATAPLYRSFKPSTNPNRSFPILYDILDNTSSVGEKMPSVTRDLNFNLTVRDNQSVGGGFAMDGITLHVTNTAGPFAITSHNTSSNVSGTITVTWNVASTTAAPISCANVDIMLSLDGGVTFSNLVTATANDGTESITLPNTATSAARIKIKCSDNVFYDINNADLRITPSGSNCGERVSQGDMSNYTAWTEYSSNGQLIIDNLGLFHTAAGSAWFGYVNNETARLSQTINIPSGSHFANLGFWYRYDRTDCGGDVFNLKINGSTVKTYNMCSDEGASDWKRQLIDMSAYIGTSPTIMFEVITNSIYPSDLFVDDVTVYTCEAGSFLVLPVELVNFDAKPHGNDAMLTWSTASETDNIGFEIEMRGDDSDFERLGFVTGNGNTTEKNDYSFRVKDLESGTYYFRLKQTDRNGNFSYSPIRQLNFNNGNKVNVYPNPAKDLAYFEFILDNQAHVDLDLLDHAGRELMTIKSDEFANGSYKIAQNISHLPNGIYFYRLKTGTKTDFGKLVIAK